MFRHVILNLVLMFAAANAWALPIDLNTFNAPVDNVVVNSSGTLATFTESEEFSPISLENLMLFIPSGATNLSFTYQLTVAINNEDYFDFYISDMSNAQFSVGGAQPSVYTGIHSLDVSSFAGTAVPVIFSFLAGSDDAGLESQLVVSDLQIAVSPVPEPGTLVLLASGLLGLVIIPRHSRNQYPEESNNSGK
jgi:hypothetical protein